MKNWQQIKELGWKFKFGPRWIRSAAIMLNGVIYEGPRHHLIAHRLYDKFGVCQGIPKPQGFCDNSGKFLNRTDAGILALTNGQILAHRYKDPYLYSEDLWDHSEY